MYLLLQITYMYRCIYMYRNKISRMYSNTKDSSIKPKTILEMHNKNRIQKVIKFQLQVKFTLVIKLEKQSQTTILCISQLLNVEQTHISHSYFKTIIITHSPIVHNLMTFTVSEFKSLEGHSVPLYL